MTKMDKTCFIFFKLNTGELIFRVLRGIAGFGSTLFIGCGTGDILLFTVNARSMTLVKKISHHQGPIMALDVNDVDGITVLASADQLGSVVLCEVRNDKVNKIQTFKNDGPTPGCTSVCIGHGFCVAAFVSGHIRMYNIKKKQIQVEISAHTRCINGLDIHPTKHIVAAVSEDTFITVWTLPVKETKIKKLVCMSPHHSLLSGVQFAGKDKNLIGFCGYDSKLISFIPVPK